MSDTREPAAHLARSSTDAAASGDGTGELSHGQILTIMSGLMLGMFLAALDQTVVATAIRVIGDDLHGLSAQAWVTTAFLITSTIATPLYGKLSDIYGRKPFFLFAISIFVCGSVLCSFATSMYMLAGFRAVQGIGAGGLFTLALSIVADIVSPSQRAKYQGYFIAVFGTSSVLGPLIGGSLAGADSILGITGWRWIFLVNVPIGIIALLVVTIVLNIPHTRLDQRVDYPGAALLVVALVPLLLVAEQGRTWGWASPSALACYAIGVLGLACFVVIEARQRDSALLPLRLFANPVFSLTSVQTALIGVGMFGAVSVLPLYLQIVKGASPTASGLLTLPLVGGIMVASLTSGQITSRTGQYRIFPIIGSAMMIVGMVLLWRLTAASSYLYVDIAMALLGVGVGLNMQTLTLAMQNSVLRSDIGVATASSTFFRQIGGTLGVAAFLSILYSVLPSELDTKLAAAASDPGFQSAAAADPDGAGLLRGTGLINDTGALQRLSPVLVQPWREGFTAAIDIVFIAAACVVAISFVLALMSKAPQQRRATVPSAATGIPVGSASAVAPSASNLVESPHPACLMATAAGRARAERRVGGGHDQTVWPHRNQHPGPGPQRRAETASYDDPQMRSHRGDRAPLHQKSRRQL